MYLPNAWFGWITRGVYYPFAIAGHRRVLRIRSIVCYLLRVAAIGFRHPDFEVPAAVRAPEDLFPFRRKGRVPIIRWIVGDPAKGARLGGDFPQVQIAAAVGGEQNPFTI